MVQSVFIYLKHNMIDFYGFYIIYMKKNQILLYKKGKKSPSAEKKGSALRPAATLVRKKSS